MASARETKLVKLAGEQGLVLEHGDAGWRLTNAETGTLVAAVWSTPDGYGLALDEIEAVLAAGGVTKVASTRKPAK